MNGVNNQQPPGGGLRPRCPLPSCPNPSGLVAHGDLSSFLPAAASRKRANKHKYYVLRKERRAEDNVAVVGASAAADAAGSLLVLSETSPAPAAPRAGVYPDLH